MAKKIGTIGSTVLAALVLAGVRLDLAHAQEARELYDKKCASCHGPEGKGDGRASKMLKTKPADLGVVVRSASEADLAKVIKGGGKAVGKSSAMPAYEKKLTDEQIQALVQFVKGFGVE